MSDRSKGDGDEALSRLLVIDRLEVGPPRLEPDRLTVPYRVVVGSESDETELSYRWEEPVLDPQAAADRNLAAVIGAQVAVNYGLFCREIRFLGPLDRHDRRLLGKMAANTAREIYVNRLLVENPFVDLSVPVVRRPSYLLAELSFPDPPSGEHPPWETDPERFAVLSSGGKDSLLSFGLLDELGLETHPIFLNESGRHWFTALEAYRRFRERVPRTARVWTSSDRVFNWMLRHLPFVRRDFGRIRADIYPIRLWTVAVFLIGALPLLKARGIGRSVIGDEHDTTVRASYQGIPHHAGLYDQSRRFDHAMSRYFRRKGWGVSQMSLLRPLSELLIEKTLAERYPELLRLQVSCHAAHVEEEPRGEAARRVRPCGRCEKCRRIVAMLLAIGADPGACGYSDEQVEACRAALVEEGIHMEREGAEHLAALLHEAGEIPEPRFGEQPARRHPEIVALRFHPERSPIDEVPLVLRRRLYRTLLEHAEGAVRRAGRQWVPFELLADPGMAAPYLFDRPAGRTRAEDGGDGAERDSYLWGELTWPEARRRLQEVDVALLPVGAIEQHGHHLPLDTDSFDAEHLCRRVAEACSEPRPLVLPLVPYGVSYFHEDFPGTLSLSNETLARLVYEIGMEVARSGISKLVIVNGHGGNAPALNFAAQMINRDAHVFVCVDTGETSDADVYALAETPNDVHAGEIETSTSLAVRPDLVRMDEAEAFVPKFSSEYLDFTSPRAVRWYARTMKISPSGVYGDPTKASAEKGERIWELMVEHLAAFVEHLKGLSLAEIYERTT